MPENITHTSLTRQLKKLEKEGIIIRRDYKQVPPKVEYSLSELGESFKPVLEELKIWGLNYIKNIKY